MAVLTVYQSTLATLADPVAFANASAAPGGDEYENDGATMLFVSLSAAPRTITIEAIRPCSFEAVHEVAFFGDWPSTAGLVYVAVATVVFGVVGVLVFRRLEPEMAVEL